VDASAHLPIAPEEASAVGRAALPGPGEHGAATAV